MYPIQQILNMAHNSIKAIKRFLFSLLWISRLSGDFTLAWYSKLNCVKATIPNNTYMIKLAKKIKLKLNSATKPPIAAPAATPMF